MSLDVFQQVLSLSVASNLVNFEKGDQSSLQRDLQLRLAAFLPLIGVDWQVVWGPVVWKNKPDNAATGPDNSWYIAYHPNLQYEDGSRQPTYVVAIAGTPQESLYAWFSENFAVNTVSDFKAWVAGGVQNRPVPVPAQNIVPGEAYIATGIVNTVHLLLTTPAPQGAASAGTTLLDFIANVDQSASPRFIVTGHSLGGILSPSLALALTLAGVTPTDRALTYPTAGPSPGSIGFTDLFVDTFPSRKSPGAASYQGWNLNLVNTLDIAPQAWASFRDISPEQNLLNIPTIYGKPALPEVWVTIVVGIVWSRSSGVRYKPLPSQYFTSTPSPATPTNLTEFIAIALPEHQDAYWKEAGIPFLPQSKSQIAGVGLTAKTEEEILYNYPLLIDLEWEREHPEEAAEISAKATGKAEAEGYLEGTE